LDILSPVTSWISFSVSADDAVFAKFRRPLGEATSALSAFFGRRSGIENLFDRLPAELADGPR
jgi:hypothetical protein